MTLMTTVHIYYGSFHRLMHCVLFLIFPTIYNDVVSSSSPTLPPLLTIELVHDETKCHIHFPDSNRSVHGEKSNQVSITGQVSAVELARKRIRVSIFSSCRSFTVYYLSCNV